MIVVSYLSGNLINANYLISVFKHFISVFKHFISVFKHFMSAFKHFMFLTVAHEVFEYGYEVVSIGQVTAKSSTLIR